MRGQPTPGPWKQNNLLVEDARGNQVCHCTRWEGAIPHPEVAEANARVIATSIDFYNAAVAMLDQHDAYARSRNFDACGCPECEAFRPIVKKAEART